jgi:hypothetical protein
VPVAVAQDGIAQLVEEGGAAPVHVSSRPPP